MLPRPLICLHGLLVLLEPEPHQRSDSICLLHPVYPVPGTMPGPEQVFDKYLLDK